MGGDGLFECMGRTTRRLSAIALSPALFLGTLVVIASGSEFECPRPLEYDAEGDISLGGQHWSLEAYGKAVEVRFACG